MATVFDVAKYVLEHAGEMTAMKLEKLVYYCQAWSLAWDDEPLFDEEFEAWANGPVCPQLFSAHRGRFRLPADYFACEPQFPFSATQIETMDEVISAYGDKESYWLSALTHGEKPWKQARGNTAPGDPCNTVIEKEVMQAYYGSLS